MPDPKKPADEPKQEEMTYPTPELDPATGAPLDTRFQSDRSQEATANQQSPKSGAKQAQQAKQAKDDQDEDDDDEAKSKAAKGKENPRGRR